MPPDDHQAAPRPSRAEPALTRLDRPELAPLWRALRDRFEQGRPVSTVRVGPLNDAEQAVLADLLGWRRLPGEFARVRVSALDELFGQVAGLDARAAVEAVTGPLADRAAERLAARRARDELWSWLAEHPVVRAEPALEEWVAKVSRSGVVDGSVARTRELLVRALAVLEALPADGVPLPALAQAACGQEHALDDGTRLSNLVLRALAALHDEPEPADAEERRALWERSGVACDALSTTVLVAGLRLNGRGPLAETLRVWAAAGQACPVTLAQLQHSGGLHTGARTVWVVENPSVLAMALARFGAACPPLVCTSGWPSGAAILLLRRLRDSGAELRYHGDFDGDGIRIAAYVCAKTDARPWRMGRSDYLDAVRPEGRGPGRITDAPWAPSLAPALREHAVAVPEEQIAADLLADLATAAEEAPEDRSAGG
ncbi:TIGR02679 family protein [Allosalinactinospora lopnorensis]|uniref:TIGR02679 family protein n=1 Tax=Allosalinactinospora lopnorensis TaxID=1352348 RepID=UPI000623CC59|nr:TIGR02679 family protein [Allosalinactinospora lopnorensis]